MKWQEPPGEVGSRGPHVQKWAEEAEALRANVGTWAVIAEYLKSDPPRGNDNYTKAGNLSRNVKKGALNAFQPAGAFESVVRTEDDYVRVYVRYVGEREASP